MTYGLAIAVDEGLLFASDSRTHAGVDQVAIYSKMHTFGRDRERQFVLLSAGNLATTQAGAAAIPRRRARLKAGQRVTIIQDTGAGADYPRSRGRGRVDP